MADAEHAMTRTLMTLRMVESRTSADTCFRAVKAWERRGSMLCHGKSLEGHDRLLGQRCFWQDPDLLVVAVVGLDLGEGHVRQRRGDWSTTNVRPFRSEDVKMGGCLGGRAARHHLGRVRCVSAVACGAPCFEAC